MKKILMMAALAFIGFTAKAQDLHNHTGCDVEFRPFCLNISTCAITYPTSTWTNATYGPTPLPGASCGPGTIVGYEIRYAASSGCSNPPVRVIDGAAPPPCPVFPIEEMGPCGNCTSSPNGFSVDFSGGVIQVHP